MTNPRASAGILQHAVFSWLNKLLLVGFKRALTGDDLFPLLEEDKTEVIVDKLEDKWKEEKNDARRLGRRPHLYNALFKTLSVKHAILMLTYKTLDAVFILLNAVLLWFFLKEVERGIQMDQTVAILLVVGISLCNALKVLVFNHMSFLGDLTGMHWKVGLIGIVYRQIITSKRSSLSSVTTGHIMNLVSNDATRMEHVISYFAMSLLGPVKLIGAIILMCILVGWQSLAGIVFLVVVLLYNQFAANQFASLRAKAALVTDRRLGTMNEIISGIRAVKMYAWEWNYRDLVKNNRREEIKIIRLKSLILSTFLALYTSSGAVATMISIVTLLYSGVPLDSSEIFTLVTLLKISEYVVTADLAEALRFVLDAKVSIDRVESFLLGINTVINSNYEENNNIIMAKIIERSWISRMKPFKKAAKIMRLESVRESQPVLRSLSNSVENPPSNGCCEHHLTLTNVSAGWSSDSSILQGITLQANAGQLLMITGPVGIGKSTLLMAIQGEIPLSGGTIKRCGKMTYVSQQPWVFSGTVRDNITFGKDFDKDAYEEAIKACDLETDLNRFPKGDLSCIGQRGVSLSGGQRARVSLARAVYSDADIVLMDDPLSAVDAKVGRHLFKECISGALSGKIRILVTHQLQYLEKADHIAVLKDGRIVHAGSKELLKEVSLLKEGDTKESMLRGEDLDADTVGPKQSGGDQGDAANDLDMADEDEDCAVGGVKLQLYWDYLRAGLQAPLIILLLLFFIIAEGSILAPMWWLSRLSSMSPEQQKSTLVLGIYCALVGLALIFATFMAFLLFYSVLRSSERLHDKMTASVIKSPILFFDTNPLGRIMNRFSKDIGKMDDMLPVKIAWALVLFLEFAGRLVFSAGVEYKLVIAVIPIFIVFILISWFYLKTSRELQRLEAVRCSPVYAHFTDTIAGLEVIRSSDMNERFWKQFISYQDEQTEAFSLVVACARWANINIDLVSVFFVTAIAVGALIVQQDPAVTGMLMSLAIALVGDISYGTQKASEVENDMTSVERVIYYTKLSSEPGYNTTSLPRKGWPEKGAVSFRGMSLVYREGGPRVLDNITLDIDAKQRVGIAGRTGAGKSSLVAALFRMPEPKGRVLIDGVELGTIDIMSARRAIAVITQDPVLFGGSLRKNLDPFQRFTDQEIWRALEQVQLFDTIQKLSDQLGHQLGESGTSFSVGERQLLCLARALLQNCKILVLDEATANVDFKTDALVQQVIRSMSNNCTVLTIAHRLNTIMDYEKVMVLDQGHVVEYDTPQVLAGKEDGAFSRLVKRF